VVDSRRMSSFLSRFFFLAALLTVASVANAALAQSLNLNPDGSLDLDPAHSELGRAQWKRTRARVGVAFSVLALPMGAGMLAAGIIYGVSDRNALNDVSDIGDPRKAKILIPIGTILIAGGLAGLGVSAHGLRVAKREVREIESQPPPTMLRFGPARVSLSHRF
jgi:hypothetical protein